jgi:hypothetical protein
MELEVDSFQTISYFSEKGILVIVRNNMKTWTEEIYRQAALTTLKYMEQFRVSKIVINEKNFDFVITPDLQKWLDKDVFPSMVKAGAKFGSFVLSENIFSQVAIEQLFNRKTSSNSFIIEYFNSMEEALFWLENVN